MSKMLSEINDSFDSLSLSESSSILSKFVTEFIGVNWFRKTTLLASYSIFIWFIF